jgi:hypothetical protein
MDKSQKRILITVNRTAHQLVRIAAVERGVTVGSLYEEGARLLLVDGEPSPKTAPTVGAVKKGARR